MLLNEAEPSRYFEIPPNWIYRGEGNCNVVLSLPQLGKILRIRKTGRPKSFIGWLVKWLSDILDWLYGKGITEELRDLQFYSTVIRPLVGRKYTSEACQVILNKTEVKTLENQLLKYRSDFRKHKILQYGRASLFDDFAFIPENECSYLPFILSDDTFAIELKPKQGWRPLSEKHFPVCIYCMHQYLKLEKKKIKVISKYCPEDLFSGNEGRMLRAIKSLIEVPQNNLRIFKNGNLIYGDHLKTNFSNIVENIFDNGENLEQLIEEFCHLIRKSLTTNFMNVDSTEHCEEKTFCEWNKIIQESSVSNALPKNSVLEKILSIQMLDTEGSDYYGKLLQKEHLEDWNYVDMLLDKVTNEHICMKCTIMNLGNNSRSEQEIDLAFIPYLISAIAKDCSLMITLKRIQEDISDNLEIKNIISTNYGHFLVNIGVIDLYPKRLSSIKKHCQRNKDVYKAYIKATSRLNSIENLK